MKTFFVVASLTLFWPLVVKATSLLRWLRLRSLRLLRPR